MKILVISSVMPPLKAAEADYALNFCRELISQSHDVSLLTSRQWHTPQVPQLHLYPCMDRWTWRELPTITRQLRRLSPDGIVLLYLGWMYAHHPMVTFLPTLAKWTVPRARFATIFYNRYGAKRAGATLRNLVLHKLFKAASGEKSLIYEYGTLLTSSDRVFALSRQHEDVFKTVYPPVLERLELLPALPLQRSPSGERSAARAAGRRALKIDPQQVVIAFFGYLYPSKGIETLLAGFKVLLERGHQARLLMIGGIISESALSTSDYLRDLKQTGEDLGISDRVTWTGNFETDSSLASEYLYASDIVALPFDHGVSLNNSSVATVAWHRCPLISTTAKNLDREFRHEQNLLLCPPHNPVALADAIERLLRDPALAKKIAAGIEDLAHTVFSWNKAIHQVTRALLSKSPQLS